MKIGDLVKNVSLVSIYHNQFGIVLEVDCAHVDSTYNMLVMYSDGHTCWEAPNWMKKA